MSKRFVNAGLFEKVYTPILIIFAGIDSAKKGRGYAGKNIGQFLRYLQIRNTILGKGMADQRFQRT